MNEKDFENNPLLLGRLKLYGLTKLHEQGFTGKGIKVGVIDVFETEHGHNVVSCINDPLCGTALGATIVTYPLPKRIRPEDIVRALKECIVDEVDIINMSFGTPTNYSAVERQIKECKSHNILMCAAAGNEGEEHADYVDIKLYPEEYKDVISWGSVDSDLNWSKFESHGKSIDFVGIGKNTVVKMKDDSYQLSTGTSFSSPHGAGIFACLWDKFRSIGQEPTAEDLKQYLVDRCVDLGELGHDNYFGYGFPTLDIIEYKQTRRSLGVVERTITMQINNEKYLIDGKEYFMDTEPFIKDGRTMVPIRFIAEALGCEVKWDGDTQTVVIID